MKFIILCVVLFATVMAAPYPEVEIVHQDADVQAEGYKFNFETSDGTSHNAEAQLKNVGTNHEAIAVHGTYTFIGDDGQKYLINYVADENGFQPQGAHIPQA